MLDMFKCTIPTELLSWSQNIEVSKYKHLNLPTTLEFVEFFDGLLNYCEVHDSFKNKTSFIENLHCLNIFYC